MWKILLVLTDFEKVENSLFTLELHDPQHNSFPHIQKALLLACRRTSGESMG